MREDHEIKKLDETGKRPGHGDKKSNQKRVLVNSTFLLPEGPTLRSFGEKEAEEGSRVKGLLIKYPTALRRQKSSALCAFAGKEEPKGISLQGEGEKG